MNDQAYPVNDSPPPQRTLNRLNLSLNGKALPGPSIGCKFGVKHTILTIHRKEIIFQLVLHIVVFIFYAFEREAPHFQDYHLPFFFNYTLIALVINYVLLPRYFYTKQYLTFAFYVAVIIGINMFVEEQILEPIYFPNDRGIYFPGVFMTLIHIIPVTVILVGFKFAWDAISKQGQLEALQAAVQESELQFLKSQINPHFLFNNLNNLYSYAIEQSPKTPTIILELSGVLRYMLYECREAFVPLHKEIEQLQNFTQLNELQIEERGEVHFRIETLPTGYRIAPLILIVFIENAFKHSQASQSDKIWIDISIHVTTEGVLHFRCRNNFDPNSNTQNLAQGIGLANVRKRLELIYPNRHNLQLQCTDQRYEVYLELQLSKNDTP